MLGWEYPPHISGGLGTACEGLTRALARQGVEIDFIVPHLFGKEDAPHMRLIDPSVLAKEVGVAGPGPVANFPRQGTSESSEQTAIRFIERLVAKTVSPGSPEAEKAASPTEAVTEEADGRIRFLRVPSFLSPYLGVPPDTVIRKRDNLFRRHPARQRFAPDGTPLAPTPEDVFVQQLETVEERLPPLIRAMLPETLDEGPAADHYSDLFGEVGRFTARVMALAQDRNYDVIHAHDWMTFPAAIALKALTGLPLILHVHSLEYDRSGHGANWQIEQIEKEGIAAADTVIAVSYYTRSSISQRHGTSLDKIEVVHNGVYSKDTVDSYRRERDWPSKIVLFLGRVTFQKGPDYFVEAAARVVPHVPDVLFVMAGSGDMLPRMMDRVNELGIGKNFLFTGFLKGPEVEKMFSMADCYVMPSVSEPFGLTALEAISFNAPVIISRQSGVSEVLSHALKVNFWDVDQLANLIVSVLQYPELAQDISIMAGEEVRRLRWDAAASKSIEVYGKTLARFS
ncbi:MAG: hypothetical protein A2X94_06360 [Bdellovibrionales bacterium GWB1_55_8]|nr:MAG: hypothetical protein A2X94_06360 [Bdellovibrionales bacterium GWB1_55_8]